MGTSHFEYVIVGAGAAGAVLAARLTEDSSQRVLLVEAGSDLRWADCPPAMHDVNPMAIITGTEYLPFRWEHLTAARTAAQTASPFWRGRGLGGSTAINGMFAVRAEPDDHDQWAKAGCPGWSWDDVLPWLNHLEDDSDFGDRDYHGRGGPYPIWRPPVDTWGMFDLAFLDATIDAGHSWCDDHNAPGTTGLSPYAASIRDGRRVSTNDAYLEPARGRDNLTIMGDALADRVVVREGRAVAVEVVRDGCRETLAGDEIILAAGAVHSPAILLRSGIGPADDLGDFGIEVVADRPGVGANLSDHPVVIIGLLGPDDDSWQTSSGRHGSCYLRYSSGIADAGVNDMVMHPLTYPVGMLPGFPSAAGICVSVWRPFSRGRLRLATADPAIDPVVDENMLSDDRDLRRMRDGVRRAINLMAHPSFRALGDMILAGSINNIQVLAAAPADDDLDQLALATASDLQHIVGTCRMGAPGDRDTVVDPSGRVVGVAGLRVIDASVIPACPRANTAITTIMLAEKLAADF